MAEKEKIRFHQLSFILQAAIIGGLISLFVFGIAFIQGFFQGLGA